MDITVYRDQAIRRETRALPAETYNLAHRLRARSPGGVAFVPIRTMQVMAIMDREEFLFLDSRYKSWAMLAWQGFRPDQRHALDEPVAFEVVCYEATGLEIMPRLPREFHLALLALAARQKIDGPARVLKFAARRPPTA